MVDQRGRINLRGAPATPPPRSIPSPFQFESLLAELNKRIDEIFTLIGRIQQIPGPKGDPGQRLSAQEVTDVVLPLVKGIKIGPQGEEGKIGPQGSIGLQGPRGLEGAAGKDGKDGTNGKDGIAGKDAVFDKPLLKRIATMAAKLVKIEIPKQEKIEIEDIVSVVLAEVEGKIPHERLARVEKDLVEVRNRSMRPYDPSPGNARGGGDTVVAGSGVTITETINGNKQISVISGGGVLSVDLSAQCNGSNKVFTVPSGTPISLIGSDAPIIYRPIVDYVVAGTTLTIASNVPAPSNGATLIYTYVS